MDTDYEPINTELADASFAQPSVASADLLASNRRNGKVARLPKTLRDEINNWLSDGISYAEISKRLAERGHHISLNNLSRWRQGGYQDWLAEQRYAEQFRARQEVSADLVRDLDPTDLNQAALQIGSLHLFEALRGMDGKLGGDPAAFARLINALARASRESLMLQKYRAAAAEARAQIREMKDPHRKLTDDERRAIIAKVDEVLGINLDIPLRPPPSPDPNPDPSPSEPSLAPAEPGSNPSEPFSPLNEATQPTETTPETCTPAPDGEPYA